MTQENLEVIKLFLHSKNQKFIPEQEIIDKVFEKVSEYGSNPILIQLIQLHVSSKVSCVQQRISEELRKDRTFALNTHYVVSFIEPQRLEEWYERSADYQVKLQCKIASKVFHSIIINQKWINSFFFDCVSSHMKLVVHTLLSVPENDHSMLKPDQTTINEVFVHCVRKGYLAMAAMLICMR